MKNKEYYLSAGKLFSIFLIKCILAIILAILVVEFCEKYISEKNIETYKVLFSLPVFIIMALAYASFMNSYKSLREKKHNK